MNYQKWFSRLLITLALASTPAAFAGTSFSIVFAPSYSLAATTSTGWAGGVGPLGGGLLLEFGGPKVGIELGGLYISRTGSTAATYSVGEGQLNLNFHLSQKMHIALGGYYDMGISSTGTVNSIAASAFKDYGPSAGLGFDFGALRIGANYQMAMGNTTTGNYVEGQIGFRFGGKH